MREKGARERLAHMKGGRESGFFGPPLIGRFWRRQGAGGGRRQCARVRDGRRRVGVQGCCGGGALQSALGGKVRGAPQGLKLAAQCVCGGARRPGRAAAENGKEARAP